MLYESITYWRAGRWLIRVHAHRNADVSATETSAALPMGLERRGEQLVLRTLGMPALSERLVNDQVAVLRLRFGRQPTLPLNLDDYEAAELPVEQLGRFPELDRLMCVSHGVKAVADQALTIGAPHAV